MGCDVVESAHALFGPSYSNASGCGDGSRGGIRMAGVPGILRKEQKMWERTDRSLQDMWDNHCLGVRHSLESQT